MGQVPPLSRWKGTNAQTLRKESSAHGGLVGGAGGEKLVGGSVLPALTHHLWLLTVVVSLNKFPQRSFLNALDARHLLFCIPLTFLAHLTQEDWTISGSVLK